jgi:predicted nucleic acid-binding protein
VSGLTLDAGALIAFERRDQSARLLMHKINRSDREVRIPAGVLAQAWRAHPRQHGLAVLLGLDNVTVVPLDEKTALACGALLAATGGADVTDASVAICARMHGDVVVTSDPHDIAALDPGLEIVAI